MAISLESFSGPATGMVVSLADEYQTFGTLFLAAEGKIGGALFR